jgi:hypothetical protein
VTRTRTIDWEAVRRDVGERWDGNSHVHWHLAPLPPGVPFEEQQLAALDTDQGLDLSDDELAELADRIRTAL